MARPSLIVFVSFLVLISIMSAQMHLHLSPELIALAAEEVRAHSRDNVVFQARSIPLNPLSAASATGITSDYFNNTICDLPQFAQFSVPYGKCFKNYIGPQPNCSIVVDCLSRASSFEEYNACLVPTVFLYTTVGAYNTSGYLVRLFVDDTCTIPFSEFQSLVIPFGCQAAQIYDEYGTFCELYQNITTYIITESKLPFLAALLAIWAVGLAGAVILSAVMVFSQF
jgi:hypothetical protein